MSVQPIRVVVPELEGYHYPSGSGGTSGYRRKTRTGEPQHTKEHLNKDQRREIIRIVRIRDNNTCQVCGVKTDENDYEILNGKHNVRRLGGNYPTMDHIIPAFEGGRYEVENLRLLCNDCNYIQGRMYHLYIVVGYRNGKLK